MKNLKIVFAITSLCICAALAAGCNATAAISSPASGVAPVASPSANDTTGLTGTTQNGYIGEENAKNIALNNAGVDAANVQYLWAKLESENGVYVYDVEFVTADSEYDYKIDAVSGSILSMDREAEFYRGLQNTSPSSESQGASNQQASNTTNTSNTFNSTQNAASSPTATQNTNTANTANTAITAEQAKNIALNHAGVSAQDAQRMEMGFDYERGRSVYEFEWNVGFMEYSCDVDANTGEIVSFSKEYDD